MKHFSKLGFSLLLSLLLCIPSALAVFYYATPMKDVVYKLYSFGNDGEEWPGDNGWSFYTNENGTWTELIPNGTGGYSGLSYPGQTFYYSRRLTEKLDSPRLKIGTVNRTVSVFLDDRLVYTDCPELDNRIGYLKLPMLESDRTEPVSVSLPPDYYGKTLTIAQSSPLLSETLTDNDTVWPCEITLYCGYAYESSLISSASVTILPASLLFALELALLAAFIWNASTGVFIWQLPVFVLALFFQICSILSGADFFYQYFSGLSFDPASLCRNFSVGTLLLFLSLYTERLRWFYLFLAAVQGCASLLNLAAFPMDYGSLHLFLQEFPQLTGFFTLLAALFGSFVLRKRGNRFFQVLSVSAVSTIGCYLLFLIGSNFFYPSYVSGVFDRLRGELHSFRPNFSLRLLWFMMFFSVLAAIIAELLEQEAQRRNEWEMLSLKKEMAIDSYENLQIQSEEIRMIRHDMMKHYNLLRTMASDTPEKIPAYLDELIGQMEAIRPVIFSENHILNILLNGKLNTAAAKGISVTLERCTAPASLPVSDSQLCCLIVNIMDNAINAASASEAPYIRLDFHCKPRHFIFCCENSMPQALQQKKNPRKNRGYGLKIISQIMQRFGENMFSVDQTETSYRITIVIPLLYQKDDC